jgi:general secretion pathway protein G
MRLNRQSGFSMLELLVAMMIIAVIATLGFKKYAEFSAQARYLKAHDTVSIVSSSLDQYYIKHGRYPDFTSFEAMVEPNSVLVKENMIPVNVTSKDPWGQPFEGTSGKGNYVLKCAGDPNGSAERAPFTQEPGKISGEPSGQTVPGATDKGTK